MKSEFALQSAVVDNRIQMIDGPAQFQKTKRKDVPLQDQFIVAFGLQCAVLAKCVKGLYDEICDELRVVILGGAALVIEAKKEMKIKAPAIIGFPLLRGWVPRISSKVEKYGRNSYIYETTAVNITRI